MYVCGERERNIRKMSLIYNLITEYKRYVQIHFEV